MSKYDEAVAKLIARRCNYCDGSGEVDDAEPGDMYYNTYKCPKCNGTGFKKESES